MAVIRIALIVLLVLYHAFAIFVGAWETPEGYPHIESYYWIGTVSYSFMLPAFVFISGLIFGHSWKKADGKIEPKTLILKKLKRLFLPSIIFSAIYVFAFYDIHTSPFAIIYKILSGAGHLWFLPMLFWCFTLTFMIEKSGIKWQIMVPCLLVLTFCSVIVLTLRLNLTLYYLIYFYIGFKITSSDIKLSFKLKYLLAFFTVYLATLILKNPILLGVESSLPESYSGVNFLSAELINKGICLFTEHLMMLIYSLCGLAALYIFINYLMDKKKLSISPFFQKLGTLCFGVYIYQQFILVTLYYRLGLIDVMSPVLLPIFGVVVALTLSIILSYLTLKTRFGRMLIG